jgi:hypothetical protein
MLMWVILHLVVKVLSLTVNENTKLKVTFLDMQNKKKMAGLKLD